MEIYGRKFFINQSQGSYNSAKKIIPLIFELVKPLSVIDIGCGVGTWLKVCQEQGVTDFLGIDGHYVNKEALLINPLKFRPINLDTSFRLERQFDLALCLEVGEHIPFDKSDQFVENLVNTAPVIVFSAAIPGQGGRNHINEQWPEFWAIKFRRHGFVATNPLQKIIWNDPTVKPWYSQNIFVYIKKDLIDKYPKLKDKIVEKIVPKVHPKLKFRRIFLKNKFIKNFIEYIYFAHIKRID